MKDKILLKIVSGVLIASSTEVASMQATNFKVNFSKATKDAIWKVINDRKPKWEADLPAWQKQQEKTAKENGCTKMPVVEQEIAYNFVLRAPEIFEMNLQEKVKPFQCDLTTCSQVQQKLVDDISNKENAFDILENKKLNKNLCVLYASIASQTTRDQAYNVIMEALQKSVNNTFATYASSDRYCIVPTFFDEKTQDSIRQILLQGCIQPLAKKIIDEYRTLYSFYKKVLENKIPNNKLSCLYARYAYQQYRKLLRNKITWEDKERFYLENTAISNIRSFDKDFYEQNQQKLEEHLGSFIKETPNLYAELDDDRGMKIRNQNFNIQMRFILHKLNYNWLYLIAVKDSTIPLLTKQEEEDIEIDLRNHFKPIGRSTIRQAITYKTWQNCIAPLLYEKFLSLLSNKEPKKWNQIVLGHQPDPDIQKNFNAIVDQLAKKSDRKAK